MKKLSSYIISFSLVLLFSIGIAQGMKSNQQQIDNKTKAELNRAQNATFQPQKYVQVNPRAHVSLQIQANDHNRLVSQGKK